MGSWLLGRERSFRCCLCFFEVLCFGVVVYMLWDFKCFFGVSDLALIFWVYMFLTVGC